MFPYLNDYFKEIGITNWHIMLFIAAIAALVIFSSLLLKNKIRDKSYNFYMIIGFCSLAVGIVCALFFQTLLDYIKTGKLSIRGMTVLPGIIGGAATYIILSLIFCKGFGKHFWTSVGLAAICISAAQCIGRIGCFLAGCCYGKPTDSFWGITFPSHGRSAEPRYPTQLFEAVFMLILFGVLLFLNLKYKKTKPLMIIYLYAYSVFRFLIEFIRDDDRGAFWGPFSPSQVQCLFILGIAAALTVYIYAFKRIPLRGRPVPEEQNLLADVVNAPDTGTAETGTQDLKDNHKNNEYDKAVPELHSEDSQADSGAYARGEKIKNLKNKKEGSGK